MCSLITIILIDNIVVLYLYINIFLLLHIQFVLTCLLKLCIEQKPWVTKSPTDPHITRVLGTQWPHIPSDMLPSCPHITRDMGTEVPKLGGPHFTRTPVLHKTVPRKSGGRRTRDLLRCQCTVSPPKLSPRTLFSGE